MDDPKYDFGVFFWREGDGGKIEMSVLVNLSTGCCIS